MINPSRLKQARELGGMNQSQLAARLDIAQPILSMMEMGTREVSRDLAQRCADELRVPLKFLLGTPVELPEGSLGTFRSRRSMTSKSEYVAARRLAEIGVEVVTRTAGKRKLPACKLEPIGDYDPEDAALYVRSVLRLSPDAPIKNLTRSLERAGVIVLPLAWESTQIDGFSAWLPDPIDRPLIAYRAGLTPFRLRFTLGHEVGHLVFGHQVFTGPKAASEDAADAFAPALLLPRDGILEDFETPITMRRLAELKGKWGVSMMAILLRAKSLGIIDHGRFRALYESMRQKEWLKCEPGDETTPAERPKLLSELAELERMPLDVLTVAERFDLPIETTRAVLEDSIEGDDLANFSFSS